MSLLCVADNDLYVSFASNIYTYVHISTPEAWSVDNCQDSRIFTLLPEKSTYFRQIILRCSKSIHAVRSWRGYIYIQTCIPLVCDWPWLSASLVTPKSIFYVSVYTILSLYFSLGRLLYWTWFKLLIAMRWLELKFVGCLSHISQIGREALRLINIYFVTSLN